MRRRVLVLAVAVAATVVVPGGAAMAPRASAPAVARARTLMTGGRVLDLAADGSRVAAGVRFTLSACDRVVVWSPRAGSRKVVAAGTNCNAGGATSAGEELGEVALAGNRLAWIEISRGNHEFIDLFRLELSSGKRALVTEAENDSGAQDGVEGRYLGDLHGDGPVLGYGTWSICVAYRAGSVVEPPPEPPCDQPAAGDEPLPIRHGEQLLRLGKAVPLQSGAAAFELVSIDARRLLTHQDLGSLTILDEDGAIRGTVPVAPGEIGGAALSGNEIAVLRGNSIEVFAADTGALTTTVPLGVVTNARLTDAKNGIAVVLVAGTVRVVRLADGAQASLAVPGSGAIDAELEASGLFYAYNVASGKNRGRVVFLPSSALPALLQ